MPGMAACTTVGGATSFIMRLVMAALTYTIPPKKLKYSQYAWKIKIEWVKREEIQDTN